MKRIILATVILCGMMGCERPPLTQEEEAILKSRTLIATLTTNASVRAIRRSDALRENLKVVKDIDARNELIADWREALKNISVDGMRPSDRYWSVREACHVLNLDLEGAMWEAGSSYEAMWDARLDTIKWLDRQIDAMKPRPPTRKSTRLEQNEEWNNYQALIEYRESEVENLEINGFDADLYPNDIDKMEEIRKKFENLIGRPVRKGEDIKRLGFYVKQARTRIQAERDAALEEDLGTGPLSQD